MPNDGPAATGKPEAVSATVLVVDDDATTRLLAGRWLSHAGFQVLSAANGAEGLEIARANAERIAVILLDVMMPGMDGFEVAAELQKAPQTAQIPLVVLTAHAHDDTDVLKGIERGVVHHLTKPFSGPVLVARLRALAERRESERDLRARLETAEAQAATDPLTSLSNRRAFDAELARLIAYTERKHEPFSVLLLDLDHFKSVNDLYGHAEGDRVLARAAAAILRTLRASDRAFRIGGEEFAVLLQGADRDHARQAAERLRAGVEATTVVGNDQRRVTVSVGVAAADAPNGFSVERLFERADEALYQAKSRGRNRVETE
jgi:diguanylate cyclase (GGDEF)-like protein